uniref:Uncharacterized protein n=1 Tax=Cacopsylla melanoneura TaxID=428564 RepID=A0A8D8Q6V8_9HEMI
MLKSTPLLYQSYITGHFAIVTPSASVLFSCSTGFLLFVLLVHCFSELITISSVHQKLVYSSVYSCIREYETNLGNCCTGQQAFEFLCFKLSTFELGRKE